MGHRKLEAKADRKTKKVLDKLKKEWDISLAKEPTNYILVCNAGLTTGSTYEELAELFEKYGYLENLILLPDKSYSFVTFSEVEDASKAYREVHANLTLPCQNNLLYLAFVNTTPKVTINPLNAWSKGKSIWPQGLQLLDEFITEEEEEQLLNTLDWNIATKNYNQTKSGLKHRQVLHFGYEFSYKDNSIQIPTDSTTNIKPFPASWKPILERALASNLIDVLPDQCTVNRYEPGQGIPPHVDTHSCCTSTILSLSLCSDIVMNFAPAGDTDSSEINRHPTTGDISRNIQLSTHNNRLIPVLLPRRSILIMSGESRYAYTHGIVIRQSDIIPAKPVQSRASSNVDKKLAFTLMKRGMRVSFTFRKTLPLGAECNCRYTAQCDSQKDNHITLDNKMANELEKTHVHTVYNEIADHFSETRHKPWPKVLEFINSYNQIPNVLIDVGCGNGKYLGHHTNMIQLGCDYSPGLLSICRKKNFEGIRCDCLAIPFRDEIANVCICIAVIHHLSTEERRKRAICEIARILKSDGTSRALIYAWAKEQDKDDIPSSYLKQGNSNSRDVTGDNLEASKQEKCNTQFPLVLPVHKNRTNFEYTDLLVPWKTKIHEADCESQAKNISENSYDPSQINEAVQCDRSKIFHRYYHVFSEGELENLVLSVPNLQIVNSYYDQGNWCVIFKKSK